MSYLFSQFVLFLQSSAANVASSEDSWIYGTQKFYIVFAVILIIFFGILGFLIFLERKISALDRHIKE